MTAPVSDALPYGVRDTKLTQYADSAGTVLGTVSVDLPYMQHLNFTEAEEFTELRGDDRLITTRGKGSQVNGDIEAGGLSVAVWSVITGGSVIATGLTPNRVLEIRKRATTSRPFWRADGKVISDSGGDILVRIYRCRANGDIQANFQDGNFATSQIAFLGMPLLDDSNDLIYSIFRRETSSTISLTPDPNPTPAPQNLTAGTITATTVGLVWTPVIGATSYKIYKSSDGVTWVAATPSSSSVANVTVTSLVTATQYYFAVTAIVGGLESDTKSSPIIVTTS
jgi:hypothetical protein